MSSPVPWDRSARTNSATRARKLREEEGDEHGIYWANVHPDGHLVVGAYSGALFGKAE
jgi:hypothetical protein